jgi:hypothetical protein
MLGPAVLNVPSVEIKTQALGDHRDEHHAGV